MPVAFQQVFRLKAWAVHWYGQ